MTDDLSLIGEAEGLGLESVSVSEHSEKAYRLFLGGSECSDIEEREGEGARGGDTEGGGVRGAIIRSLILETEGRRLRLAEVVRGEGGPNMARSSASRFFTREGVTGYRGFLLMAEPLDLALRD